MSDGPTASNRNPSWDDLRVFAAVAATGSLSRAAQQLGLTQPTVGRRLDRLEDVMGVALVRRTTQGCELTAPGLALLPHAESMRTAAAGVDQFARATRNDLSGTVRIATGDLPAHVLATRLPQLVHDAPELKLEILTGLDFVSLERGDADIGLRNARPDGENWVVQSLGFKQYAVFANPDWIARNPAARLRDRWPELTWAGFERSISVTSSRWLDSEIGRPPDFAFSSSLHILAAATAGAAMAVLPLYVGDEHPQLERVSDPLDGLGFESFLVVHPSARRIPRVRWVIQRLAKLMRT